MPTASPSPTRLWGIFARKVRWGLTVRGWLAVFVLIPLVGWMLILSLYPFLAVTHRVDANLLVVEGWIHEYAVHVGAEEFKAGSYRRVFTTGGPTQGTGAYISDAFTAASVGASRLRKAGVAAEFVQMVPSHVNDRDRTYSSAIALREWFHKNGVSVTAINIVTEDFHARRTRLLFEKAFGDGVKIGIIAVINPDYDPAHWWRYSEGVRDALSEAIAYLYARFLFFPP